MKLVCQRFAAFVFCLLITTTGVQTLLAQQTNLKQTENKRTVEKKEVTKVKQRTAIGSKEKRSKVAATSLTRTKKAKQTSQISNPISLVNTSLVPEFLAGQAKVVVRGNQDPIIRLGIARNGSTVVEFPASDNFFAVHPGGGSDVVTVDESPTLATDHYLVFRAGKDFALSLPNSKQGVAPKATVSIQMESGMFLTLIFYPVSEVTQMAHRVVVIYSREEVTAARRDAGLAVNLSGKDTKINATQLPTSANNSSTGDTPFRGAESVNTNTGTEDSNQNADKNKDLGFEVKQALQSALNAPKKFTLWSKPLHGLSISTLAPVDLDKERQLVMIAVKNTTSKSIRLIGAAPEMDVLTLNEKGKAVLIQALTKYHVETTAANNAVPANSIIYYAALYEPPVLSVNQRIRFQVANRDAADKPAAIFLSR